MTGAGFFRLKHLISQSVIPYHGSALPVSHTVRSALDGSVYNARRIDRIEWAKAFAQCSYLSKKELTKEFRTTEISKIILRPLRLYTVLCKTFS